MTATGTTIEARPMKNSGDGVVLPPEQCPNCRRSDALVSLGGARYCAACGYSSDVARGCT